MFIYSMRAGTIRFFSIVCVALAALVTLIAFVPALEPAAAADSEAVEEKETLSFEKVRDNQGRIAFLSQFGWEVESEAAESTTVTIPREFDKVFAAYNEMQKKQGLDLTNYAGKTVESYTYVVTNYEGAQGTVYANLLISRGRVIGGDVCSADADGFVHGFAR